MQETAVIRSIDDACSFIQSWLGIGTDLPGPAIEGAAPRVLHTLNSRFGMLWDAHDTRHEAKQALVGLFNAQDRIVAPGTYAPNDAGVVRLAIENQGVWEIGFRPHAPETLLLKEAWFDLPYRQTWWSPDGRTMEQILTFILLQNFAFCCTTMEEDTETWPGDASLLLYDYIPFNDRGFWTNADLSLICYECGPEIYFKFRKPRR